VKSSSGSFGKLWYHLMSRTPSLARRAPFIVWLSLESSSTSRPPKPPDDAPFCWVIDLEPLPFHEVVAYRQGILLAVDLIREFELLIAPLRLPNMNTLLGQTSPQPRGKNSQRSLDLFLGRDFEPPLEKHGASRVHAGAAAQRIGRSAARRGNVPRGRLSSPCQTTPRLDAALGGSAAAPCWAAGAPRP
jgi:hypothetical protein